MPSPQPHPGQLGLKCLCAIYKKLRIEITNVNLKWITFRMFLLNTLLFMEATKKQYNQKETNMPPIVDKERFTNISKTKRFRNIKGPTDLHASTRCTVSLEFK